MSNQALVDAAREAQKLNEPLEISRTLRTIAREIRQTWPKVYFGAVPYLDAMGSLDNVRENYGEDSAKLIVLYFLSNATSWRGPDAKRIKAELKKLCGIK